MHYDTTVGCDLEAPLKGGGIQQLDRVQGYRDRVTHCQPGLNLKVGKKRPHLGTLDPIWAKCSKSGQNFSRIGQKKFIHVVPCAISCAHGTRVGAFYTCVAAYRATVAQGCRSATRFRDCHTKKKIKKTCFQQPLIWSRVGPSLAPVYNPAKHKICAFRLHEMYVPRS